MKKRYAVGFDPQDVPEDFEAVPVDALVELPSDTRDIVINAELENAKQLFDTAYANYKKASVGRMTADEWRKLRSKKHAQMKRPAVVGVYIAKVDDGRVVISFYDDGNAEIRTEVTDGPTYYRTVPAKDVWRFSSVYAPRDEFTVAEDDVTEEGE